MKRLLLCALVMALFALSQALVMLHRHGELGHRHVGWCATPDQSCNVGDVLSPAPLAGRVAIAIPTVLVSSPVEPLEPALVLPQRPMAEMLARGPPVLL